jgi:hypothetical protein
MANLRYIVDDLLVALKMDELPPPVAWTMGFLQGHGKEAKLSTLGAKMPIVIRDYLSSYDLGFKQLLQDYPKFLEVTDNGPGLDAVKLATIPKAPKACHYFLSKDGCQNGDACKYRHTTK